jgi:hypothetical protein
MKIPLIEVGGTNVKIVHDGAMQVLGSYRLWEKVGKTTRTQERMTAREFHG